MKKTPFVQHSESHFYAQNRGMIQSSPSKSDLFRKFSTRIKKYRWDEINLP